MSRSHLILLALLAALAISYLSTVNKPDNGTPEVTTIEDDYYLKDFTLTAYDRSGRITHHTRGKTLRQLSGSHDYELDAPRILLETEETHWELTAQSGWMNASMDRARLRGNVIATTTSADKLQLTTSDLDLDIPARIATTDTLVNITQGSNRLRGEALTANLKTQQLQLKSNIEGYYVP